MLVASRNGHLEVVCLLSDAGADKDIAMQGDATSLLVASQSGHMEVVRLLSGAGADEDIAMQGGGIPCSSHLRVDTSRWSVCALTQGRTRTSQIRAMAMPPLCPSHLGVDTWRWSVRSLMQGPTRTSQCRVVPLLCSSHLGMDTWRWSVCSRTQGPTGTSQRRVAPSLCHRISEWTPRGGPFALWRRGRQGHRRSGRWRCHPLARRI